MQSVSVVRLIFIKNLWNKAPDDISHFSVVDAGLVNSSISKTDLRSFHPVVHYTTRGITGYSLPIIGSRLILI